MSNQDNNKFYQSFEDWFMKNSDYMDLWGDLSICDASEQLSKIADNIFKDMMKPITLVFIENGNKEDYEAAYREYLNK